jgi:hypothetical protein
MVQIGTAETRAAGPAEHRLERVQAGGATLLRHASSGVLFLPWHRSFRLDQVHRYDEAGHNISVRYAAGPAALLSVYVFPADPLVAGYAFEATFQTAVRDMLASFASTLWANERATAFAHAGCEVVSGRRVEAAGYPPGGADRPCHALVELFARRRWLLKWRATYQPELRGELESFLSAWLAASRFGGPTADALTRRLAEG